MGALGLGCSTLREIVSCGIIRRNPKCEDWRDSEQRDK